MKRIFAWMACAALCLACWRCSEAEAPQPDPTPEPDPDPCVELSAGGTANCYVVTEAGDYRFDATVCGNGAATEGLEAPVPLAGSSARLLWQTAPEMIPQVELTEGEIRFTVADRCGNALIALCDESGTVLWSWHIWFPEAEIAAIPAKTGYEVMNLNLGAMTDRVADPASYGMLYQWGRKDPFPAAATLTGDTSTVGAPIYDAEGNRVAITNSSWTSTADNTLAYAIAHPMVALSNYAQYNTTRDWLEASQRNDALWGNPQGLERDSETNTYPHKGAKSFYDPCPVGWRVPPADVFRTFTTSGGYAWTVADFDVSGDYRYGWTFCMAGGATAYFPAAARFDGSYAMLMGSMSGIWGNYWGNAPGSSNSFQGGGFVVLSFDGSQMTVSPSGSGGRADAYSVRCIRE